MAPLSCTLNQLQLDMQLSRYRLIGLAAAVVHDVPQHLVLNVNHSVADSVIEAARNVEISCCPFFEIEWIAERRQLSIRVSRREEAPALDAIRRALGLRD